MNNGFLKEYIVIHHTGIKNSNEDPYLIWESIKKAHQSKYKSRFPWYVADYHFGISKDLRIFEGNPLDFPCFHCGDDYINFRSIAITFFGNFDLELFDKKQFELGVLVVSELLEKFNIKPENILKHSDIIKTNCPGKNFPFDEFKRRIKMNLNSIPWKRDVVKFAKDRGWIKGEHDFDEIVDMGTLLAVLKNFFDSELENHLKGGEIYGSNK